MSHLVAELLVLVGACLYVTAAVREGGTNCQSDALDSQWISNISVADVQHTSATLTWVAEEQNFNHIIKWRVRPDNNNVTLAENFSSSAQMFNDVIEFTVRELLPDTMYEVRVCRSLLLNLTASDNCGSCDVYFTTLSDAFISIRNSTITRVTDGVSLINITVTCDFAAYPSANVTWFGLIDGIDAMLVNDTGLGISVSTLSPSLLSVNSTLVVESIGVIDRVIGPYVCTAYNGAVRLEIDTTGCSVCSLTELVAALEVTLPLYAIIILAVGPLGIVLTTLVVVCCCWCFRWRRRVKKLGLNVTQGPIKAKPDKPQLLEMSQKDSDVGYADWMDTLLSCLPAKMVIHSDSIKAIKMIGQGEFGVVYRAQMKLASTDEVVAVKAMKGIFATQKDISKVVDEVLLMEQFNHPNVMTLIGVCVNIDKCALGPSIVMPFMIHGSLLDYLRGKGNEKLSLRESADDVQVKRVQKLVLNICLQIAKGMEYLSGMKFVHRDLAARNCMIDDGYCIRVGDFGLTEDVYATNYFRQEKGSVVKLPVKWMAPESMKLGLFSEATDVWSFGVTCWEVCSSGQIPYPGLHPQQILDHLEDGHRLQQPSHGACPDKLYALMTSCWEATSENRPLFTELVNGIDKLLQDMADYLPLSLVFDKEAEGFTCNTIDASGEKENCTDEI